MVCNICHWSIFLVPLATAFVRFLADWFWISNIFDLHRYNHYVTRGKWYGSLFGFFTAALFSFTFVTLYLIYHGCLEQGFVGIICIIVSMVVSFILQRMLQTQWKVSICDWYQFVIGQTDSARYLGKAIRKEHWDCKNFRQFMTITLANQEAFIVELRKRMCGDTSLKRLLPPVPPTPTPQPTPLQSDESN
jgi:hypothetical protein